MTSADAVAAVAGSIDGWLSEAQGRALMTAAATVSGRGAIVEIGSWKGRSTAWLAHGARLRGQPVYAIDPHRGSSEDPAARTYETFLANLRRAGVADVVRSLVMTSEAGVHAISQRVELLFVDGDHSVEGALRDAQLWLPRVMSGGTVMFHDVATSGYAGPRRAFQRHVCRSDDFHHVRRVGSMAIAERTGRRSSREALRARIFDLLLYRYDCEGALKRRLRRLRALLRPPASSS